MTTDSSERTVGLWVIGIVAVCLGLLGSCAGTFGVFSIAVQDSVAQMQDDLQQNQPNEELRELNREMQRETMEVARQFRIPSLIGNIVNVLASFALMIAAILLFRWHPSAPIIFIGAVAFSIVADLIVGGVGVIVQQQTVQVMEEFTQRMGEASSDPGAQRMLSSVMRASGTFGLCMAIGWLVAKLGFYVGAVVYLRKETVRALFG